MASKGGRPTPKFTSFRAPMSIDSTNKSIDSAQPAEKLPQEREVVQGWSIKSTAVGSGQDSYGSVTALHPVSRVPHKKSSDQSFFLDSKGDIDNQLYGALYKYSVPRYRRSGFGSVLGVSRWWKIDRESEKRNGIEMISTQFDQRSRVLRQTRFSDRRQELKIKPAAYSAVPIAIDVDYIALKESKVKKRKRSSHTYDSDDSQSSDEKSDDLADMGTENTNPVTAVSNDSLGDQDLEASSIIGTKQSQDEADKSIADLNRRLRADPSQGSLWLELADATNRSLSSASTRDIAEARMSILDQGIRKLEDASGRETLLQAYVKEAEVTMDSERLSQMWDHLIKKNSRSISLRFLYLRFLQTNFSAFRLYDFRDRAFEAISVFNSPSSVTQNSSINQAGNRVDLLLHITSCLRCSGFCELANAIWQINLESNFFMKRSGNREQAESIEQADSIDLENFWESESRRIGEAPKDCVPTSTRREDKPAKLHCTSHTDLQKWSLIERNASSGIHLSARVGEDDTQDDPFRIVMFSDLKDCIIATASKAEEQSLLDAFLAYFQLPSYIPERHSKHQWIDAILLTSDNRSLFTCTEIASEDQLFYPLVNSFQLDDVSLFAASRSWFSPFSHMFLGYEKYTFPRLALQRLAETGAGSEALAEYLLGLELFAEPSNARKVAKRLLKKYPASVRLYNAYALIEARCGREVAAEDVLRTVLASNKSHKDSILLKRTWLWLFIDAGKHHKALARLLDFGHPHATGNATGDTSAIAILKTRKAISLDVESLISLGNFEQATRHIELGVLLEYLSSSTPLVSALDSLKSFASRLPPSTHSARATELLHQFRAHLIYSHHTSGEKFVPVKPREILLESIRQFPGNAIFFSVLEVLDPWVGANDRLHTILTGIRDSSATATSERQAIALYITPHLYAVRSEVRRYVAGKSTVHAVRHTFENAVSSDSGAHCPLLWRWFCEYEHHAGEMKKTRQTFYRAIRACPWVKDLYMMAFDELRSAMSSEDLKGVYELMEDKELRIRTPLDETLIEEKSPPRTNIRAGN